METGGLGGWESGGSVGRWRQPFEIPGTDKQPRGREAALEKPRKPKKLSGSSPGRRRENGNVPPGACRECLLYSF